jgi:hypothetical protein
MDPSIDREKYYEFTFLAWYQSHSKGTTVIFFFFFFFLRSSLNGFLFINHYREHIVQFFIECFCSHHYSPHYSYHYLGSNLIPWSTKKQSTVSRSSTEAEYRALASATMELTWLSSILTNGVSQPQCSILWCDNINPTYLVANPMFHAHTKHINIDCHFVRDEVASRYLQVCFLSSKDQLADVFTKPLVFTQFINIRNKLNVHPGLTVEFEGAC